LIKASAPGKIILVGEHFVVYNKPAIATAINLRAHVFVKKLEGDFKIKIYSKNLSKKAIFNMQSENKHSELYPIYYAAYKTMQEIGKIQPVEIIIDSQIPPASGMGSSAAVSVATVKAISSLLDVSLSKDKISKIAYEAEKIVHGRPSGIDNTISTYGGTIVYQKDKGFRFLNYDVKEAVFILVDTGIPRNTGLMVRKVRLLNDKYPEIMNLINITAEKLVLRFINAMEKNDLIQMGELFNINQGLLAAINVSNKKIEELIYAARNAGALGAKITGAGGGGYIIILTTKNKANEIMKVLRELSEHVFLVNIATEGVRLD